MTTQAVILFFISAFLFISCRGSEPQYKTKTLRVTATAYNSLPGQTWGDSRLTFFGDTLKPGMRAIAVSNDLIDSGLVYGTVVTIEGLDSGYVVQDKMHSRWRKRIDIYMGEDYKAARVWGKRKLNISWVTDTVYD